MTTHRSSTRGLGLKEMLQACLRIAVVAAALGIPQIAPAQEAPQKDNSSQSDNTLQEVVVTGSRVARSTFTTPNPVTVLDSKDITNLGLVNVGDVPDATWNAWRRGAAHWSRPWSLGVLGEFLRQL